MSVQLLHSRSAGRAARRIVPVGRVEISRREETLVSVPPTNWSQSVGWTPGKSFGFGRANSQNGGRPGAMSAG
jgi:hypothetical protein